MQQLAVNDSRLCGWNFPMRSFSSRDGVDVSEHIITEMTEIILDEFRLYRAPSSAGPYQWTAELAPGYCQKFLSFVVGTYQCYVARSQHRVVNLSFFKAILTFSDGRLRCASPPSSLPTTYKAC